MTRKPEAISRDIVVWYWQGAVLLYMSFHYMIFFGQSYISPNYGVCFVRWDVDRLA